MRPIQVVPHFHWDREWYLPFETFQQQLVDAFDLVLDLLDDDRWAHFHLDGQTVLVDDYLALRPEREHEILAHVGAGRLSCGPWVTLVDEFLVSGESIIRNLEDGIERAGQLGGAMVLGYLPDQFGHIGQMPQLLRRVGITHAIVWRGVPREITGTGFTWVSSDGSSVDAFYLPFGYANGRKLMSEPDRAADHLERAVAKLEPFLGDAEPTVVMAGGDHVPPSASLTGFIDENRRTGAEIAIASLREVIEAHPAPTHLVRGELRSAARANLLPNTYSVRVHQKRARARTEHLLERYAEPLAALVPGAEWPEQRLKEAWRLLHLNGAHDSVCGCSTDEVAHAVDRRTDRVDEIARSIARGALERLSSSVGAEGTLLFNPSPFERDGVGAMGWKVTGDAPAPPRPIALRVEGSDAVVAVDGNEFRFTLEDQGEEGDLYTFCPSGPAREPRLGAAGDGSVRFSFDDCDAVVSAASSGEGIVRLTATIDNRAPDHRLRLVLRLPEETDTSAAGSPFEIVRRPIAGEGGDSEPPSPWWPARGFAMAGSRTLLSEGVFEYELTGSALAMTLLRCVGTISRYDLATRRTVAGPDVPTPEAQMIGTHDLHLGLAHASTEERLLETWERYALPLMRVSCAGRGRLPSAGKLVDLDVPALSSVRRRGGPMAVTVWNPFDESVPIRIGDVETDLGPHRIETIVLDD